MIHRSLSNIWLGFIVALTLLSVTGSSSAMAASESVGDRGPAGNIVQWDLNTAGVLSVPHSSQVTAMPAFVSVGSISGTVTGSDGVTPIADVYVSVVGNADYFVQSCTNASGQFTLSGLPLGEQFQVQASPPWAHCTEWMNYVQEFWPETNNPNNAGTVVLTAETPDITNINFTLSMGGVISGTAFDAAGSTPLSHIAVGIQDAGNTFGQSVCTDANGQYAIHGTPFNLPVRVRADAYHDNWCDSAGEFITEYWPEKDNQNDASFVTVTPASPARTNINFTLDPGGVVSGIVYAADGVTPLPNISVSIVEDSNTKNQVDCTDENGQYIIHSVRFNIAYRAQAYSNRTGGWCEADENYLTEYWPETPNYEDATVLMLTALSSTQSGINFTLEQAGSISGTVFKADGVTPIADIYVMASGSPNYFAGACTDSSGQYTLSNLPLGVSLQLQAAPHWTKCAQWRNYVPEYWQETDDPENATPIILTAVDPDHTHTNFTLEAGGAISGTVYAADGVTRLSNMAVSFQDDYRDYNQSVCADANGHYEFHGIPLNLPLRVRVDSFRDSWCDSGGDYLPEFWQNTSDSTKATLITLTTLTPTRIGINFTVNRAGSISGTVYEADGVTPIPNMLVQFFGKDMFGIESACTDGSGYYTIHNVPFGLPVAVYTGNSAAWCGGAADNFAVEFWSGASNPANATRLTVSAQSPHLTGINFSLDPIPASPAFIDAWYQDDHIEALDWPLNAHLKLQVDDPATNAFPDFVMETDVSGYTSYGPTLGIFDFKGQFDLRPGMVVIISGDSITRLIVIDNLTVTSINYKTDTVAGTTGPNNWMWMYFEPSCCRSIVASGGGLWKVDYSVPGLDGEPVADLLPGSGGTINVPSGDGSTSMNWTIPDPNIDVWYLAGIVEAFDWAPGTHLTLQVEDPNTLLSPDYSAETDVPNSEPTAATFDISGQFQIEPGMTVRVSGDGLTRQIVVDNLTITYINQELDTITGTTAPDNWMWMYFEPSCCRPIVADDNGNWFVDYSVPGPNGEPMADIGPGSSGAIHVPGGQGKTSVEWLLPLTAAKPSVPILLSPANGVVIANLQPSLDWKDSTPAPHHYQLQVAANNTFSVPVINKTNLVSSNFSITSGLLPGKLYYWRVKSFNVLGGANGWSAVWTFKTPLAPPTLVSPSSGLSLLTDRPAFDWNEVSGATQYILQISAANDFSTFLVNATVSTTDYRMSQDLPQNELLHWRVQAKSAFVAGDWSDTWSFTSGNPPTIPVLVAPIINTLNTDYQPLFKWMPATLPAGVAFKYYELQVDDDADFSSLELDDTSTTDQFTSQLQAANPLAHNAKFYWRMRAVGTFNAGEHASAWSPVWNFRTRVDPPTLIFPANGYEALDLRPTFQWSAPTGPESIAGYTIQISKNSAFTQIVHTGNPTGLSYTPTIDLPKNAPLYWRVQTKGANGPSAWSGWRSFTSANSPTTPVLSLPAQNILITNYLPLFKWTAVSLPLGTTFQYYELQVDNDSDFSSLILEETSMTNRLLPQFQTVNPMPQNSKLYWRVRAVNSNDEVSNWSTVRHFRTIILAPQNLIVTLNASLLQPTFDWDDATGSANISGYTIQISTVSNFSSLLLNSTTVSSSYTMAKNLPAGKTIFWRVRVNGVNGPSAWSNAQFILPTP